MSGEELRALAEAATPGPWEVLKNDQGHPAGYEWMVWSPSIESEDDTGFVGQRGAMDETGVIDCSLWGKRDAAFIAAANPTAVVALLDERDALRGAVERAHALADEWERHTSSFRGVLARSDADLYANRLRAALDGPA